MQSMDDGALRTSTYAPARRVQPIIYSTLSMEGIKELAVQNYDIVDPVECTFVSRSVSDTYKLSTQAGQFALKIYRKNWRPAGDTHWELTALQHLNSRGVEVAMPVARRDGDLITEVRAPEGTRRAVLFHWARGFAPKYTNASHANRYGYALARLHDAGNELPESSARAPMDMAYLLEEPLAGIRTRLADYPAIRPKLAALEERLRIRFTRVRQELEDWGFCHGDVWTNNARIDGDRLVMFDFDFSGKGWRIFDLASYRWDARRRGVEHLAWEPFIDGYLQVRPSARDSVEFVGLFMILKHLWTAALFIGRSPETGTNLLSEEELEDLVPFCERIEADMT